MSKLEVHIGQSLDEIHARVLSAVTRMEAGDDIHERHIGFEFRETMVRILSPKRLGRDYKNVHEDVVALEGVGLLDKDDDGLRADHDTPDIRLSVAL